MPAVVNHEERRQQIARIAADLISSVGLDAMTMREIAAAAGFSTTIVTHYFANKRELMLYTYRASVAHAQARDACDLPASIEALLPFDESSLKDWKVFLAFWQIAQVDPDFAAEQRAQAANADSILRRVLMARAAAGRGLNEADVDATSRRLLVFIVGLAVQAVFDTVGWSPQAQRAFLKSELRLLAGAE